MRKVQLQRQIVLRIPEAAPRRRGAGCRTRSAHPGRLLEAAHHRRNGCGAGAAAGTTDRGTNVMNVIAKAKAVEAAPAVLPEEIRAKLTEAKARFGALTTRQMELAEKSVQSSAIEAEYFRSH